MLGNPLGLVANSTPLLRSRVSAAAVEFRVSQIQIDSIGKIHWTVYNQDGVLTFYIEQLLNEHWQTVGQVVADGHVAENTFSYSPHLTSGENKYRIGWDLPAGSRLYSNVVRAQSKKEDVYFRLSEDNLKVSFTGPTFYMVYNPYGFITVRGFGDLLDISDFKPGMYCVTYDNKVATFEKKPVWFSHSRHPIVRENKPEHFKKAKKPYEMLPP
jgi:hypothetical protein